MQLDIQKLEGFNLNTQLTIGRTAEQFRRLADKATKTASEQDQMAKLLAVLAPFDLDAANTPPKPGTSLRDERKAAAANSAPGVVLNAKKVDAACLTGAQSLALHRKSAALGQLLSRGTASLSVQDGMALKNLKDELRRFVGMEGRDGKDEDFKVAVQ